MLQVTRKPIHDMHIDLMRYRIGSRRVHLNQSYQVLKVPGVSAIEDSHYRTSFLS